MDLLLQAAQLPPAAIEHKRRRAQQPTLLVNQSVDQKQSCDAKPRKVPKTAKTAKTDADVLATAYEAMHLAHAVAGMDGWLNVPISPFVFNPELASAAYQVSIWCGKGIGPQGVVDHLASFNWLKAASVLGSVSAKATLGKSLVLGYCSRHAAPLLSKGGEFLAFAAGLGSQKAALALASCYLHGLGDFVANDASAMAWLRHLSVAPLQDANPLKVENARRKLKRMQIRRAQMTHDMQGG